MFLNNRKMMKIGMIIILWFCLTGGLVVAQEKRAYTLFDADGQETDYAHYRRDTQLPDSTLDGI